MAKHSSPRRQRGRAAPGRIGPTLGGVIDLDGRTWLLAAVIVAICLLPVGLLYWLQPSSTVSTLILSAAILVPCLIFAGMILIFGGATPRRSRWLALGFVLGGALFAFYGGSMDAQMRAVTLYEARLPGSEGVLPGASTPVREVSFVVEHPTVTHTLSYWPARNGPFSGGFMAEMQIELRDPTGALLINQTDQFQPRAGQSPAWSSVSIPFTPPTTGTYTLRIIPITSGIPLIHVRVEDPLKRDGQRVRGY
jgi:hypothetical protein